MGMTTHFGSRQQHQKRYGRNFDIKSQEDLIKLDAQDHRNLCLRVIPKVELVRGERFLDEVIAAARRFDLPVEISGSVLGHAFYKFQSAGLVVYHSEPSRKYDRVRERHVFDKLVRDEIPSQIQSGGEQVVEARLSKEQVGIALAAKLIEELFELINAADDVSRKAELADIVEVVRGLIQHFGFGYTQVSEEARKKRKNRGGFQEGKFLVQTSLPKAEQSSFAAQLSAMAVRSIKLGKIRYRRSGTIVPFAALTQKGASVVAGISERDPNTHISIEVTDEGLHLKLIESHEASKQPAEQMELLFEKSDY